jgi:hypothetical protein
MPRTIRYGRGGFYVETATDLGAARDEVPALQHHDPDLLLYRKVFRPFVWPASLNTKKVREYVVEKEKSV